MGWTSRIGAVGAVALFAAAVAVTASRADFSAGGVIAGEGASQTRVPQDNLFHVKFVGEKQGWITGYHGTVLRSDDRGKSWNYLSLGTDELIRRGAFPNDQEAWLVGHRGSIFHSGDAGETWSVQHHVPGIYLRDIAFLDRQIGWAVGHEGTILKTQDGGSTWQTQEIGDWTLRDLPRLSGIAILDANRVVVVGEFGAMAYTRDGGDSWAHILVEGGPTLTAIAAMGESVLAVGLDGVVAAAEFSVEGLQARKLPLNIPTHLLDIRTTRAGVLVSGFGVVVRCLSIESCEVYPTADSFPSQFLWLGGVDLAQDGSLWTVGVQGHVGRAPSLDKPIATQFVLGGPGWSSARAGGKI